MHYIFESNKALNPKDYDPVRTSRKSNATSKENTPKKTLFQPASAFPMSREVETDMNPIGIGYPLAIRITEVYTGNYESFFGKTAAMMVGTAIKAEEVGNVQQLALNYLYRKAEKKKTMIGPDATLAGSSIVFYTPALISSVLHLKAVMSFERVPAGKFDAIANSFKEAGNIPMFIANAAYLIGAGIIVGTAGKILRSLLQSPEFEEPVTLNIDLDGIGPMKPGYLVLIDEKLRQRRDPNFSAEDFMINEMGRFVTKNNHEYQGDMPYVVLHISGKASEGLSDFAPTALTASTASRFLTDDNLLDASISGLVDIVRDSLDVSMVVKAKRIAKELQKIDDRNSIEFKKKKTLLNAYKTHIQREELRDLLPEKEPMA